MPSMPGGVHVGVKGLPPEGELKVEVDACASVFPPSFGCNSWCAKCKMKSLKKFTNIFSLFSSFFEC